jgi:hypothetical protein
VRLLIRQGFLLGYFIMLMSAFFYLIVLMLWCIIGVLISPTKSAPYATALVCFIAHAASVFDTLRSAQLRVQRIVRRRVAQHSVRLQGLIYPAVLDIITNKNADQALHDAGYSLSKVNARISCTCICKRRLNSPIPGRRFGVVFVHRVVACRHLSIFWIQVFFGSQ